VLGTSTGHHDPASLGERGCQLARDVMLIDACGELVNNRMDRQ
jgi:hypothetical protein